MRLLTMAQLHGFRCYEASKAIELDHVNLFVGPNNAGKSALLLAIRRLVSVELQRHPRKANPGGAAFWGPLTYLRLTPGDLREGSAQTEFQLTVGSDAAVLRGVSEGLTLPTHVRAVFDSQHDAFFQAADASFNPSTNSANPDMEQAVKLIARLPIVVLPEQRGLYRSTALRAPEQPDVREERVDADELLPTLLGWQCETAEKIITWRERASKVLGQDVDVRIVPREEALYINIGSDGFRRVEMLGAGVTSVLTYALALTKYDGGLLLYEEPELHLHPAMQRRLVEDLYRTCTEGRWQAMVTTHSNHVIDLDQVTGISLFQVHRKNSVSSLRPVGSNAKALREVVVELGARPSSLLQSNAVIWVEGPSDATYLRFFLSRAAAEVGAELREGADFSFAFFGGALLTYERLTDTPVEALVKLLSVHANSFVVLDSDRATPDSELGKTYARQFVETCEYQDRLWVAKGREVENYLHPRVAMWAASGQVADLPAGFQLDAHGIFSDQVTALRKQFGRARAAHDASESNKPVFAARAVEMMAADAGTDWLDRLDLRERLHALVAFIRKCGGFNAGTSIAGSLDGVST